MQRYLRITKESALGTASTAPGDSIYPLLTAPDSFKVMTRPEYWRIMDGMGFAVPRRSGTETTGLAATLTIPVAVSQAEFLLGWALQRIAAGSKPWATTEPLGDLASCRLEYGWSNFEGTLRTKAFRGCKVASAALSGSRTSPVCQLALQLVGCVPEGNSYDGSSDPAAAVPTPSAFAEDFLLFHHLRGGLTIGPGVRTNFESFAFSVQNALKAYFDEYRFANAIRLGGRTTSLRARLRLKESSGDRAAWEQGQAQAAKLEFNDGAKLITIDLRSQNFVDQLEESFPSDEEIYYDLTLATHLDKTGTASDFTLAVADAPEE